MRPFVPFEEKNMAFMVNHNVEFTLVQLTATGLKKGIMDATAPMRTFFFEKGVHNYEEQHQGPEHKHLIRTVFLDGMDAKETTTSLYRPITKKGDPRLWIYGLQKFTQADDIHAICILDGQFLLLVR